MVLYGEKFVSVVGLLQVRFCRPFRIQVGLLDVFSALLWILLQATGVTIQEPKQEKKNITSLPNPWFVAQTA